MLLFMCLIIIILNYTGNCALCWINIRDLEKQDKTTILFIFQILASEREKILETLKEKEGETESLSKKNETLAQTTENLQLALKSIEAKTDFILEEKANAEKQ